MRRAALITIAEFAAAVDRPHPVRVAIDGRTASGKTTVANEMAHELDRIGRATIRTSIDGFHRPKRERYARGRHSAEGYYFDARDLDAVRRLLLEPLGPGGSLIYSTASFDLDKDEPIVAPTHRANQRDILIVDGTFLQRSELRDAWEVVIFVDVDVKTAGERGTLRDANQLGGREAAEALYRDRYAPAFEIYERLSQPIQNANIVLDNREFETATVRINRPV
ncbi:MULTISPECIES: uridylate kinase [unclassified Bradyrhizobium]|uniref:uridylate kinase n=1 Tax=unclassified Bradyrhizobium TaxID=2631580 RepID=UPI0028E8CA2F|nr:MULTISPECIES: uridylate kinase [unclassified Bradyrhizobium]